MKEAKRASLIHLVVALLVLVPLGISPLFFLEPPLERDPMIKAEELQIILAQFNPEDRKRILKHINVRDDRLVLLPYERLEEMVNLFKDEPEKLAALPPEKREARFERTLEQLDRKEPIPIQLQGVGIVEQIGAPLPLDLVFRDETGKKRPLGSYFQSGKPIILTLNYSDCPQLCHIQLNNFVEVMDTHKILPGQDFEIITVSINPNEGPTKARNAKKNYLKELNASSESWHFLTTDDESTIKKLAQVVGFNYKYDPIKKDYAHSSTLIFCSPGGVVTQYYQGIVYEPKELTRKIDEARQGIQLASDIDENFLNCKVIDNSKPFATLSMKIMKVVASIVAVGLILTLAILWMLPNRYPAVLPPLEGVKHT